MATKKRSASAQFRAGLAMRKRVLGDEYVERALATTDPFWMPFQEILTESAWGGIWTRPGLDPKTRSLLTVAMCIALNRPNEVKIHLRGAVRNGCTPKELRELVLHSFVYCGGPAALDAYHVVKDNLPALIKAERGAKKRRRAA